MSLQGTIETFAIADVIRLLAATNKSGRLQVQGPARAGTVWVDSATILGAESLTSPFAVSAAEVLFQMLRFERGSFRFELDKRPPQPSEPVAIEEALTAAESMLVEWRELESIVPDGAAWVSLAAELPGESVSVGAAHWRTIHAIGSGTSVAALGQVLERGELDTARAVSSLAALGLVTVGDAPAVVDSAVVDFAVVSAAAVAVTSVAAPSLAETVTPSLAAPTAVAVAPVALVEESPNDGDARRRLDALAGTLGLDLSSANGAGNGLAVPPPPPAPAFEAMPVAFAPPPAAAPPAPEAPTGRAEVGLTQPEGLLAVEATPASPLTEASPAPVAAEFMQPPATAFEVPGYGNDYPGAYVPAAEFAPPGYPAPPAWGDNYDYSQPPPAWAPAESYQFGETMPVGEAPTYEPLAYEPPTYAPPTYAPPTFEQPTYAPPVYGQPDYGQGPIEALSPLSFGLPDAITAEVPSAPLPPLPPPVEPVEPSVRLAPPAPPAPSFAPPVGQFDALAPQAPVDTDATIERDVWNPEEVARVRAVFDTPAPPPPPAPPVIGREAAGQVRDGWTAPSAWFDGAAPERIAPPPPPPPPPGFAQTVGGTAEGATEGAVLTSVSQAGESVPSDDPSTIEQQLFNLSDRAREAVKRSTGLFDGRPRR